MCDTIFIFLVHDKRKESEFTIMAHYLTT